MFPFERQEIILKACKRCDRVTIQQLLQETGSSLSTLRRDINSLINAGQIKKFRGGVSTLKSKSERNGAGLLYDDRAEQNLREKQAIGMAAQQYIEDGDILVLLYGTTTIHVARNLDPARQVTIITNGIDIVYELKDKPNAKVIVLGGIIDYSNNCISGSSVLKMLMGLNPTKVMLGAGGITEEKGVTNYEFLDATYVSDIVTLCQERIVVADHTKFGRNVLTSVMNFTDVSAYVTDVGLPEDFISTFERNGVSYTLVDPDQAR